MLLNANQNGQPWWKQAAKPEDRVVAPAVGSTTEGVQTGRRLLTWSLTVRQGEERKLLVLRGDVLPGTLAECLFRCFPASEMGLLKAALTCFSPPQPVASSSPAMSLPRVTFTSFQTFVSPALAAPSQQQPV